MRPASEVQLPQNPDTQYARDLNYKLKDIFRTFSQRLNAATDGRIGAIDNASPSVPTTGMYAAGDFVRNSLPSELGTAGAKYVITGWLCITAGSPGTFVQQRSLTGN